MKRPGAWELPMGTPLREIIEEHAGGMRDGLQLCAPCCPAAPRRDFLPADDLDVKMDFDSLEKAGSRLGTGHA